MLVPTIISRSESPFTIPTWSGGTDAEIVKAIEKHYNNEIDLTEYWNVGEERVMRIDAISTESSPFSTNPDAYDSQYVTLVLMNEGGKDLIQPINGHTECLYVVGIKNVLAPNNYSPKINDQQSNSGGWNNCSRRIWLNTKFRNAVPESIRGIFKLHKNMTGNGGSTTTQSVPSSDYFALPAEKEMFGTNSYANPIGEASLSQFEYYSSNLSRQKYLETMGEPVRYWLRSSYDDESDVTGYWLNVNDEGSSPQAYPANYSKSIESDTYLTGRFLSPFGVI